MNRNDSTSKLLTAARSYRDVGLCALPAIHRDKRPAVSKWKEYQSRLPQAAELDLWFGNGCDAICLVAGPVSGNLELIDFDLGGELFDAWAAKIPEDLLAKLVIESSQSGGRHVVYRCQGAVCGNLKLSERCDDLGSVATLIETRGDGGIFLCFPTTGYELIQGDLTSLPVLTADERECLLAAARELNEHWPTSPQLALCGDHSTPCDSTRPGDDFNRRGDVVALLKKHGWRPNGSRSDGNQHWTRPGKSQGTSATLKDGTFYVFSSNAHPFDPNVPYSPFAVLALLEHGGDFETAARQLKQEGFGDEAISLTDSDVDLSGLLITSSDPEEPTVPAIDDPGPVPSELLRVPGFISEVTDYCIENAPTRNPAMAFCGALALQSFLGGRKVRDPADNRTNLYMLALAPTGSGKDYPRKINKIVLSHIGMGRASVLRFASGEAIEDKLAEVPCLLCQTDEFDGMLLQIKNSRDGRFESLMDRLKEIYTSADQSITTRCLAKTESTEVHQPSLTLLGTAVPTHYYSALSAKMLTDGFFSRTICVEATDDIVDQDPKIIRLPDRILETATRWARYSPTPGNIANHNPSPTIVPMTDAAQTLIREVREMARQYQNEANAVDDAVHSAIWSRVRQTTHKLALIHAISENHRAPRIDVNAVSWARDFSVHQARRMLFMAQGHVSDDEFDEACKKALRVLTGWRSKHGNDAIMVAWRFRQRMNLHPQKFKDVVFELEQRQQIQFVTKPGKTKPSSGYQLKQERST